MVSGRTTIGRQAVLVLLLAVLVLTSLPVSPAGAKPLNDARGVDVKVKDFKSDCEGCGGTSTTRPSAMDDDKTIANCEGGTLDGWYCVYTPTTKDCGFTRDEADDSNGNPGQSDITNLAPTDTPDANPSVDQAENGQGQHVTGNPSSDDRPSENHPQKEKGKQKDKKRGKHGKGRR